MNRIEGLRSKLQHTNEQKKLKEDANREMQTFLEAIKPAVLLFHARIGCSDVHSALILECSRCVHVSNMLCFLADNMKQVLGDIEEQIVTVLQGYHAKVEANKNEQAPIETFASANLTSHVSHSKQRRASVATRSRRVSVGAKAVKEFVNAGDSSRKGSSTTSSVVSGSSKAQQAPPPAADDTNKPPTAKSVSAMLSKEQPYRYAGLRPPHLSMEELRKKDNVEEEYPLTYHELKVKVWHSDASQ
ncbi:hypothetical protein DVH05_022411 [Phytophthora capsici]|nr:hypothetical protein DVH05_022411 [Phytophthora capsici]